MLSLNFNPRVNTLIYVFVIIFYRISGVTGVELLAGLHWYLKHWCGAHISWDKTGGIQLSSVPKSGSLPCVQEAGILVQRPIPWHYYQNAVTSSCKLQFSILFVKTRLLHVGSKFEA